MPFMHALTIINESTLPAVVTQVTMQMHDGLQTDTVIKQTHIPIEPQQTVELAKQSRALSHVMGLTVAYNNTEYYFSTTPPHTGGFIIIKKGTTIQLSPEVTRISQELQIPENKHKEARLGPRLI